MKKTEQPTSEQKQPAVTPVLKNITRFIPTDLDGNKIEVDGMNKLFGNSLYFSAQDLAICEVARKIYNQDDFDVSDAILESVKASKTVVPWLVDQFVKYLQEK